MATLPNIKSNQAKFIATLAASSVAMLSTPAFADEIQQGDEIEISYSEKTVGAGGNAWVTEKPQTVNRGIIDKIEVCHGRYINAVTVYYNGRRGTTFGGPGGNCDFFEVPKTTFINEVIVWRGDWINAIQFITEDGSSNSNQFGDPAGGARVPIQDPNGGSLRQVNGKSGDYVNQLELVFGLPYYVDDIDIKVDQPLKKIRFSNPKQIDVNIGNNCQNPLGTLDFDNKFSKSATQSHSFTFSNTTGVELTTKFKVGAPIIAEGQVEVSASTAFTFETTEGAEETNTVEKSYKYSVPKGRRIDAAFMAKEAEVKLPFTYKLYHYRNGNKRDHLPPKTYTGVYEGVLIASAETKLYEVDCKTGERVQEIASVDDLTPQNPAPDAATEPSSPVQTAAVTGGASTISSSTNLPSTPPTTDQGNAAPASSQPSNQTTTTATRPTTPDVATAAHTPPVPTQTQTATRPAGQSGGVVSSAPYQNEVSCVYATNGSDDTVFRMGDDGLWRELSADESQVRFTFEEIGRDEDTVELFDINRGVFITLDIGRGQISYAPDADSESFDIYSITGSEAG